jgi:hypothetical protein
VGVARHTERERRSARSMRLPVLSTVSFSSPDQTTARAAGVISRPSAR